jgi:spermidine/putrescine transport system ATP-binding protein
MENEESIQAFDFFRTVDEIKESVALDTDLIRWADAYAWSTWKTIPGLKSGM